MSRRPSGSATEAALAAIGLALLLLWAIQLLNWASGHELNRFGIWPRHGLGAVGIVLAPLLHGSFGHLLTNSLPLGVGLGALWILAPRQAVANLVLIWLGTGMLVWLFGRSLIHVGASGVVYGLLTWACVRGVQLRNLRGIGISLGVAAAYVPLLVYALPRFGPVSWESHLAGIVAGWLVAVRGPGLR